MTGSVRLFIGCACALAVAAGCQPAANPSVDLGLPDAPSGLPCSGFMGLGASLSPSPKIAVVGVMDVTAIGADSVVVEYGDDASYGFVTPHFALAQGKARIPVLGFRPLSIGHARAVAYCKDVPLAHTDDLTVKTAAMPDWATPLTVATPNPTLGGYILLATEQFGDKHAIDYVLDRSGRVMWYWDYGGQFAWAPDTQRQPDGNFTLADGSNTGTYVELDLFGDVKRPFSDTNATVMSDQHEVLMRENGNTLILGMNQRLADVRQWLNGSTGSTPILTATVDEFKPDGTTAFHWASDPEIGLDETTPDAWSALSAERADVLHANSLWIDPVDENYVVSFRNTDSVVKVDKGTNHVLWRLGGSKSDFKFINDPQSGFSHQHFARYTKAHTLVLFDNGNLRDQKSRAVEYQLDETPGTRTATLVWSAGYPGGDVTDGGGSVVRLESGNTLVSWCAHPAVTEFDAKTGKVIWEIGAAKGPFFYRALYLPTLYPPG